MLEYSPDVTSILAEKLTQCLLFCCSIHTRSQVSYPVHIYVCVCFVLLLLSYVLHLHWPSFQPLHQHLPHYALSRQADHLIYKFRARRLLAQHIAHHLPVLFYRCQHLFHPTQVSFERCLLPLSRPLLHRIHHLQQVSPALLVPLIFEVEREKVSYKCEEEIRIAIHYIFRLQKYAEVLFAGILQQHCRPFFKIHLRDGLQRRHLWGYIAEEVDERLSIAHIRPKIEHLSFVFFS
mmetsp:Transcript_2441/g.5064  ORF Transcript_2441/g.5064 Transcript_2441/m.5064 type:complete len:235 (-) Transcript_2441:531-1235(-)